MTKTSRSFNGSFEQLQLIVELTGTEGAWQPIPYGWCYRCHSGALLNWWPNTGAVTFQGPPERAAEFEAALLEVVCGAGPLPTLLLGNASPGQG